MSVKAAILDRMTTTTETFSLGYHGDPDGAFVRIIAKALEGFTVELQTHQAAQEGTCLEGEIYWADWCKKIAISEDGSSITHYIDPADVRTLDVL